MTARRVYCKGLPFLLQMNLWHLGDYVLGENDAWAYLAMLETRSVSMPGDPRHHHGPARRARIYRVQTINGLAKFQVTVSTLAVCALDPPSGHSLILKCKIGIDMSGSEISNPYHGIYSPWKKSIMKRLIESPWSRQ